MSRTCLGRNSGVDWFPLESFQCAEIEAIAIVTNLRNGTEIRYMHTDTIP